jgi:hypothetical protein
MRAFRRARGRKLFLFFGLSFFDDGRQCREGSGAVKGGPTARFEFFKKEGGGRELVLMHTVYIDSNHPLGSDVFTASDYYVLGVNVLDSHAGMISGT